MPKHEAGTAAAGALVSTGALIPFAAYLERAQLPKAKPVVWSADAIRQGLAAMPHGERGTLALADPCAGHPGAIVHGLSLAVQVVHPGERTTSHRHSFWHLYLIQRGHGSITFDQGDDGRDLVAGDVVLVPAWCPHGFVCRHETEDFVMMAMQNLPECAGIGSLFREGADGSPEHVVRGPTV